VADVIRLPTWAMEMTQGTVCKWQKTVGQDVQKNEPLVEIETDKVTDDLQSPYTGTLLAILVPEGTTVSVGTPLAVIGDRQETVSLEDYVTLAPPAGADTSRFRRESPSSERQSAMPTGVQIEPAARRLAMELGIDLMTVAGTGPNGRITLDDVRSLSPYD
jgi:pyruvate dehydrogenase E2 component (dihydrolipoamide acetyltransferase)